MTARIVERNVFWGAYGKSINRVYSQVSAPSVTPRFFFHEKVDHSSFAEANKYRITTPYWGGADQVINENVSRSMLRSYIFAAGWYGGCANELTQLLKKIPTKEGRTRKTAFVYEQIGWCTHVAWCVYSMLLASNIYPMWWSTGVRFAKNMDYIPPEFGYEGSFDWLSKDPRPALIANATTSLVAQPFTVLGVNTTLDVGMDRSTLIQWFNFQKNMPWAGRSMTVDSTSSGKTYDPNNEQGLALLIARAGMFGGLDRVADSILMFKDTEAGATAMVAYWKRMAQAMATISYWRMVSGGVAAWKWYCIASLSIEKLGVCREDMISLFDAHKDAQKFWRLAAVTGLIIDTAKIMYKAISGDLYDFAKDYYKYARKYNVLGQEAQDKIQNPNVPPYEGAFVMPPMFIRAPFNAKYSSDMMRSTNKAYFCETSGACEELTGTSAALLNLEKSVRATESVLADGTQIWDPPEAERVQVAVDSKVKPLAPPPKTEQPKATSWVPLGIAGAVTGVVSYLLWKAYR